MTLRGAWLAILAAATLSLPTVLAGNTGWFFFWPVEPDNNGDPGDIPAGQPQTNSEFEDMLKGDAEQNKVIKSEIPNLIDGGVTFWYGAFMDEDVVEDKYEQLSIIRAINKAGRPSRVCPIDFMGFPAAEDPPNGVAGNLTRRGHSRVHHFGSHHNSTRGQHSQGRSQRSSAKLKSRSRHQKREIITQSDASRQLKALSLPRDIDLSQLDDTEFKYDDTAGFGSRVYVLDTGINFDSLAWMNDDGRRPEILYATDFSLQEPRDLEDHGSCMADIAVGTTRGVAKRAEITAVQLAGGEVFADCQFLQDIEQEVDIDALAKAATDMIAENKLTESVIVMAFNQGPKNDRDRDIAFGEAFAATLDELDERGVSVVSSFPNDIDSVIGWPALFGDPSNANHVQNLITVGSALINDGLFENKRREPWITAYAPGADHRDGNDRPGIQCATGSGTGDDTEALNGNSVAAALVGGVMAYYKGLGLSNDQARERLTADSFRRAPEGGDAPNMIWNGAS